MKKQIIHVNKYEITVVLKNNGYEEYYIKLENIYKMIFVALEIKSLKYKKKLVNEWLKSNKNSIELMI